MTKNEYISWQLRSRLEAILIDVDRIANNPETEPALLDSPENMALSKFVKLHTDFLQYVIGDNDNSVFLRNLKDFSLEIEKKPFPHPRLKSVIKMN
jgi:hypothetical protein